MEHSWEVVCVTVDDDAEHDDCRRITEIGYKAPTLRRKQVDQVASMIESELSAWHLETDAGRVPLQAVTDDRLYVRTLDEDSPDDPLLSVIDCNTWEQEDRLDRALG